VQEVPIQGQLCCEANVRGTGGGLLSGEVPVQGGAIVGGMSYLH